MKLFNVICALAAIVSVWAIVSWCLVVLNIEPEWFKCINLWRMMV